MFGMGTGVTIRVWSPASLLGESIVKGTTDIMATWMHDTVRHEREKDQCGQAFGC